MIYVATRKGVFTIDRSNGAWAVAGGWFLGDNASTVFRDPRDGAVYVGLGHGHFGVKLHRSDDGGASWTELAAPSYPDKPADLEDIEPNRRIPIPWSTQLIWTLEGSASDPSGALWCGTIPGGLFRSTDRGATWELMTALWNAEARREWFGGGYDYPGIHSVSVHPDRPAEVAVGVSCGGVWVSDDGGATWTCKAQGMWAAYMPPDRKYDPHIQDPHRVVRCANTPTHLWAQHHNGVFRTTNNAETWAEVTAIEPSSFGFAVAVHPHDPDRAWFVPGVSDEKRIPVDGQLVVARTQNGGESFDRLTHGLPQKHAYDLTYRHAMDIDADGDVIAFGTTTGSLFVSEDQGDSWQSVSHHLPPIHTVCFAG